MYILGRYPEVAEADTPSDVIWENIGYTKTSKRVRCCINWVFVLILLIISLAGTIMIMEEMSALGEDFNTAVECPPQNIIENEDFKFKAWEDQQRDS